MKTNAIWTPYANLFLGLWLISGAFTFGYTSEAMVDSDVITGFILVVLALLSRFLKKWWLPWTTALLGVWLQLAPLIFWASSAAYTNDTLVGALVIIFAVVLPEIPGQFPDTGPSVPPGWSYNPSSWGQRLPIALFALVGWFLSRYLAAYQLGHIDAVWDPVFGDGTEKVITSALSQSFPVSDAGLGSVAYAVEALLTCQGGERRWRTSPWMVLIFGILVIPTGLISILLIISQPLVVGAWCFICLLTALCSLFPVALALDEVVAVYQYLKYSKEKTFWRRFFEGGNCAHATLDKRSPSPAGSILRLFQSSWWGVTAPLNLTLSAILGVVVMCLSLDAVDDILGPLVIVVSVVAMSEKARVVRYLNLPLALGIAVGALFLYSDHSPLSLCTHLFFAVLIFALVFRRGPIREKTRFSSR
jgi:hypothetical protein